jgi:tRNA 2-thiouridine synthesizing protein A
MGNVVDARGLSCPQPVLMTLEEMTSVKRGRVMILVDTDTSKENVTRAIKTQGWEIAEVQPEGTGYRITISKD